MSDDYVGQVDEFWYPDETLPLEQLRETIIEYHSVKTILNMRSLFNTLNLDFNRAINSNEQL